MLVIIAAGFVAYRMEIKRVSSQLSGHWQYSLCRIFLMIQAQQYLADGITEELIGRLAGIRDLRVISRTSVMRFKNTQLSVPEIARVLGVDAVVEGSVMREGAGSVFTPS